MLVSHAMNSDLVEYKTLPLTLPLGGISKQGYLFPATHPGHTPCACDTKVIHSSRGFVTAVDQGPATWENERREGEKRPGL